MVRLNDQKVSHKLFTQKKRTLFKKIFYLYIFKHKGLHFHYTPIMETTDRNPAFAGQFYPANPEKLKQELVKLFSRSVPCKQHKVRAIISPHAGYVFSGKVAASSFNQIVPGHPYKRVFILASSHQNHFEGASIYCNGDFLMPYGKEHVDTDFCKELVRKNRPIFTSDPEPHLKEHSLETLLPFLNYTLKSEYTIVPILLGTSDPKTCKKIAEILKPWFHSENLFIISTDFSHYPNYLDAKRVDRATMEAILLNQPDELLKIIDKNEKKRIPHLVTSLCGWTSVLTLLHLTTGDDRLEYFPIDYQNSGDSPLYGDNYHVVGYWSISVIEKEAEQHKHFRLSESEKNTLLNLARTTLEEKIRHGKKHASDPTNYSENLHTNCGAFVSLHVQGKLRGCIGKMTGNIPLFELIQEMTVSSAMHDPRFHPVSTEELATITIELSILSPLQRITDVSEIKLGKHGVYIVKGRNSGVFLPQVATETGWNLEQFLGHCARDKAGLNWEDWKNAEIYIFTATVFGEEKN